MMQLRNIILLLFLIAVVRADGNNQYKHDTNKRDDTNSVFNNNPSRGDFDKLNTMNHDQLDLVVKMIATIRSLRDEIFPQTDDPSDDSNNRFTALFDSLNRQRELLEIEQFFHNHTRDVLFPIREENDAPSQYGARDCKELLDRGFTEDNVYTIQAGSEAIKVYCNMSMGGWIVFQRRFDGSVDFARNFEAYAEGFGNFTTEFWQGLKNMNQITKNGNWELRVDFESYGEEPRKSYAEYNNFRIGDPPFFTFNVNTSSYKGTAGNGFWNTNGVEFSTYDRGQNNDPYVNCSQQEGGSGGWWWNRCGDSNANGMPFHKHRAIRLSMGERNMRFYKSSEFKIRLIH